VAVKLILFLLILGLLAFGLYWWSSERQTNPNVQRTEEKLSAEADRLKERLSQKLDQLSLNTDQIRKELAETGKVVRQKAREAGAVIADATADARITAAIKAKYVGDSDLSALSISVNTTGGVVTLSGTVSSHENIGKAMAIALEVDGVREVISTRQVRQAK
jgi:hyperosmotically inducible periplasmic protein